MIDKSYEAYESNSGSIQIYAAALRLLRGRPDRPRALADRTPPSRHSPRGRRYHARKREDTQ